LQKLILSVSLFSITHTRIVDGGDGLQMWWVAANIVNKQSRTADKGWYSSFGVGLRDNDPPV